MAISDINGLAKGSAANEATTFENTVGFPAYV